MRKWLVRGTVVVVLVAAVLVARATVFATKPIGVHTVRVERGRVESTITNSKAGTIKARRRAELSTGASGIVLEVPVKRGDRVPAGTVLLRLDDGTERAQRVLAERELELAEARNQRTCIAAERARSEFERHRELAAESIISQDLLEGLDSAFQLATADCAVALADVARARAAVDAAQVELDKTTLRAPFDAIVAEVNAELGEWVTPSIPLIAAPTVIDAIDPSSIYVSAPMDEVDVGLLRVGLPVRVTIDPLPERAFAGKIARVAPYVLDVEQQNRTLEIEVELEDTEFAATLLPGTSADVEVILTRREDVLRVPSHALLEGGRVLVVENGRLVEREVETGLRNWDWTEITGGLSDGDSIVTSLDLIEVRSGVEVEVLKGPASP